MTKMVTTDGGRAAAGFRGRAGDCVCRSIAIASGVPYAEVHAVLAKGNATQRQTRRSRGGKAAGKETADLGIRVQRLWFRRYMESLGFRWTPTMRVGSGCTVHLRADELPAGRLVVAVSRHYTAVIDGVIHDTHDPSREGTRCVYGYWSKA